MTYFSGKRAAISGAGDGIGRALAMALNAQGCELWLCDINSAALDDTVRALPNAQTVVHTAVVDCGRREDIDRWANEVASETSHLDALFNNAGVAYGARFEECDLDNFEWLININLWGVIRASKAFLPLLKQAPVGHLVNFSSIFGMVGIPTQTAYNTAKFGVRGFSEALQTEWRSSSIKVSSVHPGGIKTNIARSARSDGESAQATADERDEQFRKMALTTPEKAANIILRGTEKGKKRIFVGPDAVLLQWLTQLFPTGYQILTSKLGPPTEKN